LVDKDMEMMDPMAGSYLLVHNLVVGLLHKADGFEHELINNNRSLSWFASELNRRRQKQITS